MGKRNIDTVTRSKATRLLQTHWRPDQVAENAHIATSTAYRWERRLRMYGSVASPHSLRAGRPRSIHRAAVLGLLEHQRQEPWLYQDELAEYIEEEWGIAVSAPTICRILKREGISIKKSERMGPQSEILRTSWRADMLQFTVNQLIFIDESLFKLQTGWRARAYAPIGHPARWCDDIRRGRTYAVLPAYTIDGYLPCTGYRLGYYNSEAFIEWIEENLLPHCNAFPAPRSVICLDNCSTHINPLIRQTIEAKGCLIRYLPPYSPDYNPIELTFSILKAWLRRHFRPLKRRFGENFEGLLRHTVFASRCDRAAIAHFRHAANGLYRFEGDLEAFQRDLADWGREQVEEETID